MDSQFTSSRVVTVEIASMAIEGLAGLSCLVCDAPMDVAQPDPNLPDRFLATCPDCLTWFLVETTGDQESAWAVSLTPLVGLARRDGLRPTPS